MLQRYDFFYSHVFILIFLFLVKIFFCNNSSRKAASEKILEGIKKYFFNSKEKNICIHKCIIFAVSKDIIFMKNYCSLQSMIFFVFLERVGAGNLLYGLMDKGRRVWRLFVEGLFGWVQGVFSSLSHGLFSLSHDFLSLSHRLFSLSHDFLSLSHGLFSLSHRFLRLSHGLFSLSHRFLRLSHGLFSLSHRFLGLLHWVFLLLKRHFLYRILLKTDCSRFYLELYF